MYGDNPCPFCKSKYTIKIGKYHSVLGFWKQLCKCRTCLKKFTREKEYSNPERHKSKPITKFKYQPRPIKKRNWSTYTESQQNEKQMVIQLTDELLDLIPIQEHQKTGRPSTKIKDIIFCMTLKIYTKLSSRRLQSDLRELKKQGYISHVPCYSVLMQYFNDERLTRILKELIHLSGLPVKHLEEHFATDASGFSTGIFGQWFNFRFKKESKMRIFRKAHITIGTKTNIITAIEVTKGNANDCPFFEPLLKKTALSYTIKTISADKGYISRKNYEAADELNVKAFIPFKSCSKPSGRQQGFLWKRMYEYFYNNPQEWRENYHRRSHVESTFGSIKSKFNQELMTKNFIANQNEILCKALNHNLCCLVNAYFSFGVNKSFQTENPKQVEMLTI